MGADVLRNALVIVLLLVSVSCKDTLTSDEQRLATAEQQAVGQDPPRLKHGTASTIIPAPVAPPPTAVSTPPRGSTMAELQAKGPIRLRACTTLSGDEYKSCLQENDEVISKAQTDRKQNL